MLNYFPLLKSTIGFYGSLILNLLISIALIIWPLKSLNYFALTLGIIAIVYACELLILTLKNKKSQTDFLTVIGIFAIAALIFSQTAQWSKIINWLSGIFVFLGGIQRITYSLKDNHIERQKYYFALIILIIGVLLIINPFFHQRVIFARTFGLILLVISACDMVLLRPHEA
ncbi:DUF308 domain-containing protein [Xylocopilactobacillus apis]|nr:DUF308 domain-containing protein [Xylocopilactobacillus apis]